MDECQHTFVELAMHVLPAHLARLRAVMAHAHPAAVFSQFNRGPAGIAKELGLSGDFPGCYVFLDGAHAIYAGISRRVIRRLQQHLRGTTHFAATLAYLMAKEATKTSLQRKQAMADNAFLKAFQERQRFLRSLRVAFIGDEGEFLKDGGDVELYLFEAFCAMELRCGWNSFRTH
jgi:predicted GIY-YIG superfamily endonuclease